MQDASVKLLHFQRIVIRNEDLPLDDAVTGEDLVADLAFLVVLHIGADGAGRAVDIKTVKSGIAALVKDHADLERRSGTVFKPENTGGGKIHTKVGKLCGCFYKGRIGIDE